ncbi:TRAP transporter small permease protein [Thalassobacillus devorans]|uniref:TRAP transporter small permease protein n=1 Tax=Thalassobacillus devorans TaxID=279813 RepID=A0ABQ1NFC8_9BACI|nr:TRAP transporter small permease [Thalassobacillus devorans]NIK27153.1 TRAP-type C4-dicarboxylate transport system permease small subunit [Thalassobacillus devorans]GGC75411.1 TRAP transporter small permease protein [Thalassobacillus devorans]
MFIKWLERIQLTLGILFLCIFFTAILIQVITRYMGVSVVWTEEVANYSFIWSVFMGASVMLNRREHFKFDLVLKKLRGKKRNTLFIINDLILLAFSFAIFFYGIQAVQSFWNYNWVSLSQMKMGYVWVSVPIMGGTMVIYTLNHIIRILRNFSREEAVE